MKFAIIPISSVRFDPQSQQQSINQQHFCFYFSFLKLSNSSDTSFYIKLQGREFHFNSDSFYLFRHLAQKWKSSLQNKFMPTRSC